MKKRFSKILGVGLTLALLASLLLAAVPVSALTQPAVTVDDPTISVKTDYSIVFALGKDVPEGGKIVIDFPTGTTITNVVAGDISLAATSGIGSDAFSGKVPTTIAKSGTKLTITVPDVNTQDKIGVGAMVQVTVSDHVGNPDTVGSYTLTVATSAETTAVTSVAYTIVVPVIPVLPGIVKVYNPNGVLMTQMTGDNAINLAIAAAGASYTIVVGAGEYEIPSGLSITAVTHKGLTLKSSDGATTTIIDGTSAADMVIDVFAANVTIDGFTIKNGDNRAIYLRNTGFTVQNNIITSTLGDGIIVESSNNVITSGLIDSNIITGKGLSATAYRAGILVEGYGANAISGVTVSNNTVSAYGTAAAGGILDTSGIRVAKATGTGAISVTVTGNNISGCYTGLFLWGNLSGMSGTKAIANNTITGNYTGVVVQAHGATADAAVFSLVHNTITNNTKYGIQFGSGSTDLTGGKAIMYNTITGNGTYGIYNADASVTDAPVAVFNWWGTSVATEVAAMVSGDVTYTPFLTDTAEAVFSADATTVSATSLDSSTTVGVKVSGATGAEAINAAKYVANPQAAIANALAFYDVYVAGVTSPTTTDVTIKFYTGDANTELYIWSADTDKWVSQACSYSAYGGYVYADVKADKLDRTPFALVSGPPPTLAAPSLSAPVVGADDVSLSPTFAWNPVASADGYYFELAGNADFVAPLVKLDGDVGRLIVTAYHYVPKLDYSTSYYWRVKAVSGTSAAGDLLESAWTSSVLLTVAEVIPEEPEPPVWTCPVCGLTFDTREALEAHWALVHPPVEPADIIIEPPDVIVPLPAETPITPSWIYAIIGVGAVLVIAMVVLIVRTRRVA